MTGRWIAGGLVSLGVAVAAAQSESVDRAVDTVEQTNREDAASQDRIDALSEQAREMLESYRRAVTRTQQLKVYNRELEKVVAEQERRKAALQERVNSVSDLRNDIEPLMLRMIDGLERFLDADLPFREREREQRIAGLREAAADPEQNVAERFRKVLAAYQAEAEYGRTIGTYRGELALDGSQRLVEFLRVGRVMLFYITPDDTRVGYWNREEEAWQSLPDSYGSAVRDGVRVAKDLAAPQLVEIAVPAPSAASGEPGPAWSAQSASGPDEEADAESDEGDDSDNGVEEGAS